MFNDPLYIVVPTETNPTPQISATGETAIPLRLTSSDAGKSTRVGTFGSSKLHLTVLHSTTKENAPYVTKRSVLRLDRKVADNAGKTVTLSAYLVVASPVGSPFSEADAIQLAAMLCSSVHGGLKTSDTGVYGASSAVPAFVERLLFNEEG